MHSLTGRITKPPFTKHLGHDKGYMWVIELYEKHKDTKTSEVTYTNYKAIFFGKKQGQIDFYNNNLVVGAVVDVYSQKLIIETYQPGIHTKFQLLTLEE